MNNAGFPILRKEIRKLANVEAAMSKASEGFAPKSREILQTFVWWGARTKGPPS